MWFQITNVHSTTSYLTWLGGPVSSFNQTEPFFTASGIINSRGLAVGSSTTTAPTTPTSTFFVCNPNIPFVIHAFEWRNGVVTDLGALPGVDNCSGAIGGNAKGDVVGSSENAEIDPLTGINESRAVLWRDGQITDIGTFRRI